MLDIAIDILFMPFNKLQCMLLQDFPQIKGVLNYDPHPKHTIHCFGAKYRLA